MAYCASQDSLFLFGGFRPNVNFLNDLNRYSNSVWGEVTQNNSISGRVWQSLTEIPSLEPAACRFVVLGGAAPPYSGAPFITELADVQVVTVVNDVAVWKRVDALDGPGAVSQHAAVSRRGDTVVFGGSRFLPPYGGSTVTGMAFAEIHTLRVFNYTVMDVNGTLVEITNGTWSKIEKLSPSQVWPSPRFSHTMSLYQVDANPANDRLVVYGGRRYVTPSELEILSDLWIYTFGTNVWFMAQGVALHRSYHSTIIVNDFLFSYGGATIVQGMRYVFPEVLVTNLNATKTGRNPTCTASNGVVGLWCEANSPIGTAYDPQRRHDHAFAQKGDLLYVYGGKISSVFGDFWVLNTSDAIQSMSSADSDPLGLNDLSNTMYFMVAILSMMVVCFVVFILSLRRQRGAHPIFIVQMIRPRVVGARPAVINGLQLKTYKKTDVRRASAGGRNATSARAPASASGNIIVPSADPEAGAAVPGQIQDDLHDLCAICLNDYADGEQLRVLPCDHFFHPPCVDEWLRTHNACPMCKAAVDLDPDRIEHDAPAPVGPDYGNQIVTMQMANQADGGERRMSTSPLPRDRNDQDVVIVEVNEPDHHYRPSANV